MRFATVLLACLPLLGLFGCNELEIQDYGCLEGLEEICVLVDTPLIKYIGSTEETEISAQFDSLRLWQETIIQKSLEKHGIPTSLPHMCTEYPERVLQFDATIYSAMGGTPQHHYVLQMRLDLTEAVNVARSKGNMGILAVTWERQYPATLYDVSRIIPYLGVATENMLIEFEHDLIDANQNRLAGYEKKSFVNLHDN